MNPLNPNAHPLQQDLVLHAGGELPRYRQWMVRYHLRQCARCEESVQQFERVSAAIKRAPDAEAIAGIKAVGNWAALEREMIGNINVGVAAANCIENVRRRRRYTWRGFAAASALVAVLALGWFLNVQQQDTARILSTLRGAFGRPRIASSIILQSTPRGICVRSQGAALTLFHPGTVNATASLTGDSSVGVRYVDDETGQVTITNVYGE
jgi:hypothetical protein